MIMFRFNRFTRRSIRNVSSMAFISIGLLISLLLGCESKETKTASTPQPTESKESITVVSFGGSYQAAQRKAYMTPFQTATGTEVKESDYNGDYALIHSRASAVSGSWDVISIEAAVCARGSREAILATIDYTIIDKSNLLPGTALQQCVGHLVFSTVLAYGTEAFPDSESAPRSWKDFFDVEKFPGKRGLRNNPRGSLEIALLGAGVPPDKLYPLDVDDAFRTLDRIKPHLEFWESGAQPVQMLTKGTVVMASAYNGRIWNAQVKENLPVTWTWFQGLMEMEYWGIPKNSNNKDAAMRFIAFSLKPRAQASFTNEIAYGPTNTDALPFVKSEIVKALPNSDQALPHQVSVDPAWWAEHEKEVSARWQAWISKRN